MVSQLQAQKPTQHSQRQVEITIKEAVARREEELRELVMKREKEVAEAMAGREEEIMEAVRRREAEVFEAWSSREAGMWLDIEEKVKEVQERVDWILAKEEELKMEDARLETVRIELEEKATKWEESVAKSRPSMILHHFPSHKSSLSGRKEKTPLEEVKNLLEPLARIADETPVQRRKLGNLTPKPMLHTHTQPISSLVTPTARPLKTEFMPSAMKGVVLTATGETLATPAPGELAKLFNKSPKVGLNFAKIFDFGDGDEDDDQGVSSPTTVESSREPSPPPSPSSRKSREKSKGRSSPDSVSSKSTPSSSSSTTAPAANAPPTRLRRPSIRTTSQPPTLQRAATLPYTISDPPSRPVTAVNGSSSTSHVQPKPLPHPHLNPQTSITRTVSLPLRSHPSPEYDLADEENLPSPFLKRTVDRPVAVRAGGSLKIAKKRQSSGHALRAVAAANAAGKRVITPSVLPPETAGNDSPAVIDARPSLANARKASEEARKALSKS